MTLKPRKDESYEARPTLLDPFRQGRPVVDGLVIALSVAIGVVLGMVLVLSVISAALFWKVGA